MISKKRTQISSENVRYVLGLQSWGLLEDNNNKDEIIISEDGGKIVTGFARIIRHFAPNLTLKKAK